MSERSVKKRFLPFLKGGIVQVALVVEDLDATVETTGDFSESGLGISTPTRLRYSTG